MKTGDNLTKNVCGISDCSKLSKKTLKDVLKYMNVIKQISRYPTCQHITPSYSCLTDDIDVIDDKDALHPSLLLN